MSSEESAPLFGVMNLHKPEGVTSRDVVNVVQRLVRPAKVGHAGTLDPMATGVLLVCVGPATRLVSILQQAPKTYRAEFRLGQTSDTDDSTGDVVETPDVHPVSRQQVEQELTAFCGIIEQTPPAYSAVKIEGKRAYSLARQGQAVDIKSRPVRIDSIEIESFEWPVLTLTIRCGSGTYIRSIARDLGERLGVGGLMSQLERTAIGEFQVETAVDPQTLTADNLEESLQSAVHVVRHISSYHCTPEEQQAVSRGRSIELVKQQFQRVALAADRPADADQLNVNPPVSLLTADGSELLALGEIRRQGRKIQPRTVFVAKN